ncbi:hypothetical protein CWO27_01395 [Vibrio sp. 10N.286.51.C3]|nr:hypothetical protein CWO27_01395 [Vibrio sp. 10N.286.51.C3]PTQ05885.1 hypothetical protein CWO13_00945 [Vibrio sp. ZF 223]TKE68731.1 hypothetical protein FCV45_10155 [Vibrio sp. F12]
MIPISLWCDIRVVCPECGHSFVMNLAFTHTLSPSDKTTSQLVFEMIKALASDQRQELVR